MTYNKNNSTPILIVSIIVLIPNLMGMVVGYFLLDHLPKLFYTIGAVMIAISIIGILYGLSLRNKETLN